MNLNAASGPHGWNPFQPVVLTGLAQGYSKDSQEYLLKWSILLMKNNIIVNDKVMFSWKFALDV